MPEPRSRWSVIAAFGLMSAATQVLWLNYAGVTTAAARHYRVSEAAIGWLANVFPLLYVVLAIPAGLVLDRWFRGGLAAGAVLTAVGALLRQAGDQYLWVLAGQTLVAVAQPLVLNAVTGITGRYLAAKDRPTGIAVGTAATFTGMIAAFVLDALYPDAGHLATLTAAATALSVLAAIVLTTVLRRPGEHCHEAPPAGLRALRTAWSDRSIRQLSAVTVIPFGAFIALTTFAQPLLAPAGVDDQTASLILLTNVVAGVIGCAIVPVLAARFRREVALLSAGLVVTAATIAALAVTPGTVVGFLSFGAMGLILLPALPIVLELSERRAGDAASTAAGLIWMAGNLGGLLMAALTGQLVAQPTLAFGLLAAATLLGVPMAMRLPGDVDTVHPRVETVSARR